MGTVQHHSAAQQPHSSYSSMPSMISTADFSASYTAGKHWIAIDGNVYDVSSWCDSHPGGRLVLLHSAARDASEAFHAYHPDWVRNRLPAFKIGHLAGAAPFPCRSAATQPVTGISAHTLTANNQAVQHLEGDSERTQQQLAASGERLKLVRDALEAQGLFGTSPGFYCKLALCCLACLALAIFCVVHQHITLGALLLGLFWQQVRSTQQRTCCACCMSCGRLGCSALHPKVPGLQHGVEHHHVHCSCCYSVSPAACSVCQVFQH